MYNNYYEFHNNNNNNNGAWDMHIRKLLHNGRRKVNQLQTCYIVVTRILICKQTFVAVCN